MFIVWFAFGWFVIAMVILISLSFSSEAYKDDDVAFWPFAIVMVLLLWPIMVAYAFFSLLEKKLGEKSE